MYLGGGFKDFWFVPQKLGKWSNLTHIFQLDIHRFDHPPGWIYHDSSHGNPLVFQVLDRASMTHLGHVFNDGPGPTGGLCAFGGSSDRGGVRGGGGCHLMHVWVVVSKIFYVHPEDWGRWTQIWRAFFSNGLVQPPTRCVFVSFWSMQFLGWISCVFLGGWLWTVFTVSWSGWWFQICFYVHRYLWMMIQFDSYVQIRWNQRLLIFSHCFLMWQVTSFQWGIELPGENMVVWTCFNNPKDVI